MKPLNLALVLAIGAAALFTLLHSHWVSEIAEDTVEAGLGVKDLDWDDTFQIDLGLDSRHVTRHEAPAEDEAPATFSAAPPTNPDLLVPPEKRSGGFLFVNTGDAYVCKEAKTDPTWNLVGGSKKEKDQDVHSGAVRAATGKIGKLPKHKVLGAVIMRYGKHKQKEYSVFIGEVSNEERKTWQPQLDVKEVTECKWISLTALDDMLSGDVEDTHKSRNDKQPAAQITPEARKTVEGLVPHAVLSSLFHDDHVNDFLFILSAAETFAGLNRRRSLLSLAASAQVASFMQLIHRKQLRS